MNNTAVRATTQNTETVHMVFAGEEHQEFYHEKLQQVRYQDCYHKALIYLLGISADTRKHFHQIYNLRTGCIKPECLREGWQTSGSIRIVKLAFNLYTDDTPGIERCRCKDEQITECKKYSVSDIFCCGYAMYFWEGIKLRYSEYCGKQKSMEEILTEMKERRDAENSINGDEKGYSMV